MAKGFEIAEGYLGIDADVSAALRDVRKFFREVEAKLDVAEKAFKQGGKDSGEAFADGAVRGVEKGAAQLTRDITGRLRDEKGRFAKAGQESGEEFSRNVTDSIKRNTKGKSILVDMLPGNIGGGKGFFGNLLSGMGALSSLGGSFSDALTTGFQRIAELLAEMLSNAGDLLGTVGEQLSGALTAGWEKAKAMLSSLATAGQGLFASLLASGQELFSRGLDEQGRAFWRRLAEQGRAFFRSMLDHGRNWFRSMLDHSRPFFRNMLDNGRSFFRSLLDHGRTFFSNLHTHGRSFFNRMVSGGQSLFSGLLSGGQRMFSGLISSAGTFISTFAQGFSSAMSTGFDQIKTALGSLGSVLSSIGGSIGPIAMFAGYAALVPLVLALGGALAQLSAALFALPAAAGFAIATIAPLIIAFQGFGGAVSAGLSGDVAKFNEALKKLPGPMREVVKEVVGLKDGFRAIKTAVQTTFFAPMVGHIKTLGSTLLPVLRNGMEDLGFSLGNVAAGFLKLLSSSAVVHTIKEVLAATSRIWDKLGPSLVGLFGAMFGLVEKGMPWVEKFFGGMSDGIDKFTGWLNEIQGNGKLDTWLQRAWEIGGQLWDVLKGAGELLVAIFGDTGDEGSDFLVGIAEQLKYLTEFFKSEDGKRFLNMVVDLTYAVLFFGQMGWVTFKLFAKAILWVVDAAKAVWHWLKAVGSAIGDAAAAVGGWFADAGKAVWGWITGAGKAIGGFFADLGRWFADAWDKVVEFGGKIVKWITDLPGVIGTFLAELPGKAATFFTDMGDKMLWGVGWVAGIIVKFFITDLPGWIKQGWEWAVQYVEEGAQKTWDRITALPGQIWSALTSLASIIGGAFMDAWHWAVQHVEEGAQKTWDRITALPGQIWEALKDLASMIGGFFSDAWQKSKDSTVSGIDSVMSFIHDLPGKIKDVFKGAGDWLYELGKDVIRGLANGIGDMLDWAVEKAKHAASKIKEGFTSVFDSHSPSRAMDREVGRTLLPGIQQGIDHTMPDFQKYLGVAGKMIIDGFQPTVNVAAPNVSVGGTTLIADLGEGIQQVVPLTIMRNPTTVAAATDEGRRQRSWVYSPRAKR